MVFIVAAHTDTDTQGPVGQSVPDRLTSMFGLEMFHSLKLTSDWFDHTLKRELALRLADQKLVQT